MGPLGRVMWPSGVPEVRKRGATDVLRQSRGLIGCGGPQPPKSTLLGFEVDLIYPIPAWESFRYPSPFGLQETSGTRTGRAVTS
jgi:hypothetical protein